MPAAWQSENRRLLQGPGRAHGGAGWGWPCPLCRLQMAEAALALSEQKAQDLGERLATAEQEHRSLTQKQAKEHRLEQQVGGRWAGGRWAGGLAGGVWQAGDRGALPTLALRNPRSVSPSCSETCLLPLRRTCSCRTRCGVRGQAPREPGVGAGTAWATASLLPASRWTSWSGRCSCSRTSCCRPGRS